MGIRVSLRTSPLGFIADGSDLVLIEVEVVDSKGNRCPTALNMIQFNLEGPAEWRGGIAQGPGNFILSKEIPVECGINRVFVRSMTQPVQIVLNPSSQGLSASSFSFSSAPFIVKYVLSYLFPSEVLHACLDRVPTP